MIDLWVHEVSQLTQTTTANGGNPGPAYTFHPVKTRAHKIFNKLWLIIARKIQMLYFHNTQDKIQRLAKSLQHGPRTQAHAPVPATSPKPRVSG